MSRNSVKYNAACRALRQGESIGTNLNCAQCLAVRMCDVLILSSRDHGAAIMNHPRPPESTTKLSPKTLGCNRDSKYLSVSGENKRISFNKITGVLGGDAV